MMPDAAFARLAPEFKSVLDQPTPFDNQVGGDHYKKQAIQPIEYILANEIPFCEGNIIKYATRWRDKGGVKDLEKIIQYAQFLIHQENTK